MATGDLHGNLERLRVQLQSIQYPHAFDAQGLKDGIPAVMLPLIHYALLGHSRHLARFLSANGYELWAKSDLRFMESTLKFLRQEFNYRSALTMAQMFARGYAERKLLFLCDIIQMCKRKHLELLKLAHEKKVCDKLKSDPSHLATARRACQMSYFRSPLQESYRQKQEFGTCAPSSSSMQTKLWQHTLRMPEGKVSVDTTGVPAVMSDSPPQARAQAAAPEAKPEFHREETSKGSNIGSSMPSPNSKKPAEDDSSRITEEFSPRAQLYPPLPSSTSLSASHHDDSKEQKLEQDFHEELCQKIMEMADRLEARFSTLEDEITKARETLQEKLVSLECRVSLLETSTPRQKIHLDHSGGTLHRCQSNVHHQETGFENVDRNQRQYENVLPRQDNRSDCTSWELQLGRRSEHSTPRSQFQENLQPCDCEQNLWIAHHTGPASIVGMDPCFNLINSRQPCSQAIPMPVLEQHSQTIRDISNTHQYMDNNASKLRAESYENQFKPYEKIRPLTNEKKPTTEEFIADIQARFNKTMELLHQDAQV